MKDYIINDNVISFDCDECNICTCENGNICENCAKCLSLDGYEARAIKIDEVLDKGEDSDLKFDLGDFSEFDLSDGDEESSTEDDTAESKDELPYIDALDEGNWEYLEDIEGMEEMLHDTNSSDVLVEQFPGLYVINKKKID